MMLYTFVNVPYCSLMGVMTSNTSDRTTLSSYRFVGVFIGQFIVMTAVGMLPKTWGMINRQQRISNNMTILSVAAIVLLYVTPFTTKNDSTAKGQNPTSSGFERFDCE
jgi:GPH family glycoside/pentoside/hexuronide:cation symporter